MEAAPAIGSSARTPVVCMLLFPAISVSHNAHIIHLPYLQEFNQLTGNHD